jgi:5-methylcytosine-specific restriction protein B
MNNFSDITFKLLTQWSEKYHQNPLGIYNSDEYDDFLTYVEQPFIEFCQVLSRKLPTQLAAQKVDRVVAMNGNILEDLIVIEPTKYDDTKLRLQEYFSPVSLLYVEINSVSIIAACSGNIYNSIFKRISQKNPDALVELISSDPAKLIQTHLAFHVLKEDAVEHSFEELSTKFLRFFNNYIPLVLLAISDDPIPLIRQYLAPPNPKYSLNQCEENTGFKKAELERWVRVIERKGQAILHGPAGTGKTYIAEQLAEHLIGSGNGFKELVQFHPAYAYEDFIQGIRPQARTDGRLDYQIVSGRFLEFCAKAESREGLCVLIIDEINRANLAQVFGELMYLLEYRDKKIRLAGSSELFGIPQNVRIIGTMNTADRSIALVDHALRRRFAFIELRPDYEVLRQYHEKKKTDLKVDGLIEILERLNKAIANKHYEIGISYFLTENLVEELEDIWQMEIEPYLEEYFYDQLEKVDEFRWDKIKQQVCP